MQLRQWKYLHDGGPFIDSIKIEEIGNAETAYVLRVTFSDPTDYARCVLLLEHAYKKPKGESDAAKWATN